MLWRRSLYFVVLWIRSFCERGPAPRTRLCLCNPTREISNFLEDSEEVLLNVLFIFSPIYPGDEFSLLLSTKEIVRREQTHDIRSAINSLPGFSSLHFRGEQFPFHVMLYLRIVERFPGTYFYRVRQTQVRQQHY